MNLVKKLGKSWWEKVGSKKGAAKPEIDPVAAKIKELLEPLADDKSLKFGNKGYTIKRSRGKGASGFTVTKNN